METPRCGILLRALSGPGATGKKDSQASRTTPPSAEDLRPMRQGFSFQVRGEVLRGAMPEQGSQGALTTAARSPTGSATKDLRSLRRRVHQPPGCSALLREEMRSVRAEQSPNRPQEEDRCRATNKRPIDCPSRRRTSGRMGCGNQIPAPRECAPRHRGNG